MEAKKESINNKPTQGARPASTLNRRPAFTRKPGSGVGGGPSTFGRKPLGQGTVTSNNGAQARGGFRGNRPSHPRGAGSDKGGRGGRSSFRKDGEREKDAFNEQVLDLRRVTRVVAGGKRFRFRATVVIGDGRGKVGVGVAKGADVQSSVAKAKSAAKKKLVSFAITNGTISHDVKAKFSAAEVLIRPAKPGHGLMAGGAVRAVLLLAGVKDVTAKCLGGTKNKLTNAMATISALKELKSVK